MSPFATSVFPSIGRARFKAGEIAQIDNLDSPSRADAKAPLREALGQRHLAALEPQLDGTPSRARPLALDTATAVASDS